MKQYIILISILLSNNLFAESSLPSFFEIKNNYSPSDITYYDSEGLPLQSVRTNFKYRSTDWVSLDQIAPEFVQTVLFSEDKNYYRHSGVDSIAFLGSIFSFLRGSALRGGSTITMQLVGLLDPELKIIGTERTFSQKLKQIQRATELEESWSKQEILTAYLNLVYFRGELRGVGSGAMGLFGKEPKFLSPNEGILLTVLIRSPRAPIHKIVERGCLLKKQIETDVNLSCDDFEKFAKQSLLKNINFKSYPNFAPNIVKILQKENSPNQITTISLSLQNKALSILQENLKPLRIQNVDDGAILVVRNATGEVLAYVSNQGVNSSVRFVDLIQAKRQAGSTLKPFVYAQSFEESKLTPSSILNDSPIDLPVFRGIYRPLNYSKTFQGKVTVTQSLGSSLNIPAVRALSYLDMGKFIFTLSNLGFKDLAYPEFYGPSLALGSADITLWELTNAYRTFANKGRYSRLKFLQAKQENMENKSNDESISIFRESVSFLVQDILSNREARSLSFGWESNLSTPFYTAVKTGTSQDMRDNWCVGFSSEYTVGVWVGNTKGNPMYDVSGVTGAGPIWREVMEYLHENRISEKPEIPSSVKYDNNKQSFYEVGMDNIQDINISKSKWKVPGKIIVPSDGTIFAFDPDIPKDHQKILFRLNVYQPGWKWVLNQKFLREAKDSFFWEVQKGVFVLELVDESGKVIDKINFEVR